MWLPCRPGKARKYTLSSRLAALFKETSWGSISYLFLAISILSGVVVALQYQAAEPFYSVVSMDLLVPYGRFFRSLHFYSSQFFFLAMVLHLSVVVGSSGLPVSLIEWTRLVSLLPLALVLLFTGYVLRADGTGRAAGAIAENISRSVPLAGNFLNAFLFDVSGSGLKRVYAQHVVGLVILFGWAGWNHLRRYPIQWQRWGWFVCATPVWSFFVAAPLEQTGLGQPHINGPWFFIGLQELLRFSPVLVAGVLFPFLGILPFLFMAPAGGDEERKNRCFFSAWLWTWVGIYAFLSVFGYLREMSTI